MNTCTVISNIPSVCSESLSARWLDYLDASPKTIATYTRAIRQFFRYLSMQGIDRPDRSTVIAYRESLRTEHKPTTVQAYLAALKLFFRWTSQENLWPNIADHVKGEKIDNMIHKRDHLTARQISTVLAAIDRTTLKGKRDYAIISLMATSGLRTISIIRANIEDFRIVGDTMGVYYQGKGRSERAEFVKLAGQVEDAIRDYLNARADKNGKAPLFASLSNRNSAERLTTRSVSRLVKEAFLAVGLDSDRLTAHSLRHSAATLNLLAGGSLEETRQLLGHSSINVTTIYSHAIERSKNNSELRIANAIFG